MAGFRVEKQTAGAVVLDDLGITLTGAIGVIVDLTDLAPENVARSADLLAAIPALVLVVDPRDDTNGTILTSAESTNAVNRANDTHFGISGGRFGAVDDPTITPGTDFIIQYNSGSDAAEYIDPNDFMSDNSAAIGAIVGAMGQDGSDTTFVYDGTAFPLIAGQDETLYDGGTNNGAFVGGDGVGGTAYSVSDVITLSDGSTITVDAVDGNGDVTDFTVTTSSGANTTAGVTLTQASVLPANGQLAFTLTPEQNNISQGTLQWDVDDSYLRNDGDTLDSGTLAVASGAAVTFGAGSTITIDAGVTTATIATPGGGFTGDTDLINKLYVDDLVNGLDWKESARVATVGSLGGTIATQDETDYDGAGSNGTFSGGTGHTVGNVITMSDGSTITVGAEAGGVITAFTVTTTGSGNASGQVITQVSSTGGGITFSTTLGTNNIAGLFDASGGTGGTGEITGIDVTSIDGIALSIGDRLVLKDQGDATQNGIYVVTTAGAAGVIERADDHDTDADVTANNTIFVEEGTTQSDTAWTITSDDPITVNTTPIVWAQVAGPGTLNAGIGLSSAGNTFDLDVDDLVTATVVAGDIIAFHDLDGGAETSGSQTRKTTFTSVFNELDVPNAITSNGLVTRTAEDTYTSRSIAASAVAGDEGISLVNGNGVAGDPTIGLDIQGLTATGGVTTTDRVAVFDGTNNVYYTVAQLAGAAGASNSFETWARTGNGAGASLVATSPTDTVTIDGGIGIDLTFTPGTDTMSIAFTDSGMADTATVLADTVPFFDASNSFEPEFRSWTNIIGDLGLLTGISAATDEDLTGIDVTGTVIGLDIVGLTAAGDDMAATDEFALHDKSEGTTGANGKITGTDIAEGTAAILGIATLTFDTFPAVTSPADDQTLLAYTDSVRVKTLSVESHTFQWADNKVKDNDWIKVGDAGDADSGWVMPLDATIVGVTAHTENTGGGNTYEIDLYIDAVDSGAVATLTGGANADDTDPTLNIDVDAGEKIRLRADQTVGGGNMQDTTVALLVKWRS